MYSLFHKLLIKSEGTTINKLLLSYYFFLSNYYSLLTSTLGCVTYLINNDPVYSTSKLGERVPTLNVVREVEEMLKQHGFLNSESDEAYNSQNDLEGVSFDFLNRMKADTKLKKCANTCDGDTTFITDDNLTEDDISLADLDEFVTMMENYSSEN